MSEPARPARGPATLTFVVVCKGRLEHLRLSLPALATQERSDVVVVDSKCPDGAGDWVAASFPEVLVVRHEDAGRFNLSRGRNAGLRAARGEWVCFVDADVVVADTFAREVIPRLQAGRFYRIERLAHRNDLAGTCVVRRRDALAVGGYDQVIEGWGGEDRDLQMRLGMAGGELRTLPHTLIKEVFGHSDAARTAHYSRKDKLVSQSICAAYRLAKTHLMDHGGPMFLTLADRRDLYAKAEQAVTQALRSGAGRARLVIDLPVERQFATALGALSQSVAIEIDTSGLSRPQDEQARVVAG